MNPSVYVSGGIEEVIRSAAGPVSCCSYSYSLIGYNKVVRRWVAVRQDGGLALSISRSFVCGIIRMFSVLWSFRVRFPDPHAYVTELLAAETNEGAL
jgi:hypothetical protein